MSPLECVQWCESTKPMSEQSQVHGQLEACLALRSSLSKQLFQSSFYLANSFLIPQQPKEALRERGTPYPFEWRRGGASHALQTPPELPYPIASDSSSTSKTFPRPLNPEIQGDFECQQWSLRATLLKFKPVPSYPLTSSRCRLGEHPTAALGCDL